MTTIIEEQLISGQDETFDLLRKSQPEIITRAGHVKADCHNAVLQKANPNKMSAKFIIVTRQKRANLHNNKVQIVESELGNGLGLEVHRRNPVVLFEHGELPFPIGVSETPDKQHTVQLTKNKASAEVFFSQVIREAAIVFALVNEGTLRMSSIGFVPNKIRLLGDAEQRVMNSKEEGEEHEVKVVPQGGGFDIVESLLIEWSITASGADTGALRQALSRGNVGGEKLSDSLKLVLQKIADPVTAWAPGTALNEDPIESAAVRMIVKTPLSKHLEQHKQKSDWHEEGFKFLESIGRLTKEEIEEQKFQYTFDLEDVGVIEKDIAASLPAFQNKLDQHFEVALEQLEASKLEYEWVSRYVGCQVKQLFNLTTFCPTLYMGSFLTGLELQLEKYHEEDVRQITRDGKEVPPTYEVVQLNSKISGDFLIDGLQFLEKSAEDDSADPINLVVKYQRFCCGVVVTVYSYKKKRANACEVVGEAWRWCEENNFLKGEAFSLRGRFLPQTAEQFEDVFLNEENKKPLQMTVDAVNKDGSKTRNRGMILMGPPGTGKTLSGRILRNKAQATFIWMSARDLLSFGACCGLEYGFDLARELAPSVLFIEDIDNFLHEQAVDLLKTEMDGIAQASGVITVLTTNYPERLPQAIIDRPGRFDDILKFDLPDEKIRREMLSAWLGESILSDVLTDIVEKTEGYSGAHLKELVNYSLTLAAESEEEDALSAAVLQALEKIEKQRELINKTQLQSSFGTKTVAAQIVPLTVDAQELEIATIVTQETKQLDFEKVSQKLIDGITVEEKLKPLVADPKQFADGISDRVAAHLNRQGALISEEICKSVDSLIKQKTGVLE